MIECEKCGANLTLDDEKCPYCNEINPDSVEHIRQLKLYQAKYSTANKKIKQKALGRNAKKLQFIAVFSLLAVMFATMIFSAISTEWRHDYDKLIYTYIKKEQYTNLLHLYVKEIRPQKFHSLMDSIRYYCDNDDEELHEIYIYTLSYVELMNIIRADDGNIKEITEEIESFNRHYQKTKLQRAENIKYIENLNSNLYDIFQYKYGFTRDEVEQLFTYENNEDILKMMEEKLIEE